MTTTSTSGAISSVGIGSGLDATSIISGLMKIEKAPLTDLQDRAKGVQATISAFGEVQSSLSTFRDAASKLALPSTWNATVSNSSDPSAVSVTTSASAATGNYSVSVSKLAAAQSTVSPNFASNSALVGSGTLHIDIGSWDSGQTAFTAANASAAGTDIQVTATDTLDTLAQKINSAAAGIGASVVNDANGARLVFAASKTGTANGFRVTATGTDATLSSLAYNPPGGTTATTQSQAADDAAATINGVPVNSSSNDLSNVLNGVTVNLTKVTTTPVQITVSQDKDAVTKSVQSFVDAYNSLSKLLATDLKYDAGTQIAGPLQGDSAARAIQTQMRKIIGSSSGASSVFSTLSQVGVQAQKDGTLTLDTSKFTSALANPAEIKKAFTHVDATDSSNAGFANQLRSFGDQVIGAAGLLTSRVTGLNSKLTSNKKDQDALSERLAKTEARLTAQYSALDKTMAKSSALGTYVSQQITNWNKPSA